MKKLLTLTLAVTLVLLSAFSLYSCGDDTPEGMVKYYDLGLTYYLPKEFESRTYSGYDYSYSDGTAEFLIAAMSYEELENATYDNLADPWPTNVYDYSRKLVTVNGIGLGNWSYDEEKDTAFIEYVYSYTGEDAAYMEDEFINYVVMDNGEAIFFITLSCRVSVRDAYEPKFEEWISLLKMKKVA